MEWNGMDETELKVRRDDTGDGEKLQERRRRQPPDRRLLNSSAISSPETHTRGTDAGAEEGLVAPPLLRPPPSSFFSFWGG